MEADPLAWLHFAGLPGQNVTLVDANLATVEAEADRLLQVNDPDYLAHLELQSTYDPDMSDRLLYCNVLSYYRHRAPVESVVILLRKEADGSRLTGQVAYAQVAFRYRIVRLWEYRAEEILSAPLALLPLAPLTQVSETELPGVVQRMRARIEQESEVSERGMLWMTIFLLPGLKYDAALARKLLQEVREMKESSTYQSILEEGRQEGEQRGLEQGLVQGARQSLILVGSKRFGAPGAEVQRQLEAINSETEIERLLTRLLETESWQELLA